MKSTSSSRHFFEFDCPINREEMPMEVRWICGMGLKAISTYVRTVFVGIYRSRIRNGREISESLSVPNKEVNTVMVVKERLL